MRVWRPEAGALGKCCFKENAPAEGSGELAVDHRIAAKGRLTILLRRGACQRYSSTPRPVPSVFVMISVMPESRVGRYACRTSIVRLTAAPRVMVTTAGLLICLAIVRYAQKKKPSGMKPPILIPTFFQ